MSGKEKIFKTLRENKKMIISHGVTSMAVFGSFVNGTPDKKSDIDILVEFAKPTFQNYFGLKDGLEKMFGRKVDLLCRDAIKPSIKRSILKEAEWVIR